MSRSVLACQLGEVVPNGLAAGLLDEAYCLGHGGVGRLCFMQCFRHSGVRHIQGASDV